MATAPNPMGYSPVPDVGPQNVPAPEFRVNPPPEAFGTNIAAAVQRLGGTIDKVGDELWDRAVAMQQIKNQAELDSKVTDFLNGTTPIHANFSSLAGRNASDGLPQYQSDLEAERQRVASTITNPWVQTHFNNLSRTQIARDYFNGAGHAGEQLKVYQRDSINQLMDANGHKIGLSPFDEQGFQQTVTQQRNLAKEHAALQGLNPDDAEAQAESRMWKERLTAMGVKDPIQGRQLLEKAWQAGKIRSDDYAKIDKTLEFQELHTGGRNISGNLFNGRDWSLGSKPIPIELAKKAIGKFESGDDYQNVGPSTRLGHALGRYQVMEAELPEQLAKAGLPPMDRNAFLRNPAAQDKLFEVNFGELMDRYGSFNEAASRWFTGRSVADAQRTGVKDAFNTNVNSYLANTNAILARQMPLSRVIDAARSTASTLSNNPDLPDYAEHYVTQHHNQVKAVERDAVIQDQDTLAAAVRGDFTNGQVPDSLEHFTQLPQVQEVIKGGRLSGKQINDIPGMYNRYINKIKQQTNVDTLNRLKGMADEDPLSFQAIQDFTQFDLSARDVGAMQKLQRDKRKDASSDPNLSHAYQIIRNQLPNDFDDKAHEDVRHQFKGALQEAMTWGMQQVGRKLKDDEVEEIGKRLLRQTLVPGWFTWITGNKVPSAPWYQGAAQVPSEVKERYQKEEYEKNEGVLTDEQIRQRYLRDRFIQDYGKQKE